MIKKKGWLKILCVLFALALLVVQVLGCAPKAKSVKQVTIGTAAVGGTYYVIGGVLADIISRKGPEMEGSAVVTGGSVENLRLVDSGEADIGFTLILDTQKALAGTEPFTSPVKVKAIATMYPNTWQVVVLKKSGIKTFEDLKGKKVAVGPAGGGLETSFAAVTNIYGFKFREEPRDFTPVHLGGEEIMDALADGRIDAGVVGGSVFNASLKAFATTHDIAIIPIDEHILDQLVERTKGAGIPFRVPPNTFPGVTEEVALADWVVQLVVREDADEKFVYNVVKTIFENRDTIAETHPAGEFITLERAVEPKTIPFHEGAIRYYREVGVWKD
ncbi:MAG: TAXI family TRAP transporter solute-binding subunit [Bacillota bacterium]